MRYISTRGAAPILGFEEVLLAGLARDGGLYVPESWPAFDAAALRRLAALPYRALALEVIRPFVGDAVGAAELAQIVDRAYDSFAHRAVVPLKQLDQGLWLLELFHGPTLAFKDVALQLVGGLFDHVLRRRGRRITIVGATSGDTGSAAIEAVRDRAAIDIFMLHPHGRVSEVQRRQMTTVASANVHNIAIAGSFDDCQDLVKAMFADAAFRDEMALSAVNSINWARVMAQTVYYFAAALALGAPDRPVSFAVPTGNFGNVYAGYAARAMGLPVERLLVGSNRNDILTRCLEADDMSMRPVEPSLSPSMDIQISSNFERLLFDLHDRDGAAVAAAMAGFRRDGRLPLGPERLARARRLFAGYRASDETTLAVMREVHDRTGELIDPHSAIAVAGGWDRPRQGQGASAGPLVALGTAHPAKFPDPVERATGLRPPLPPHLADLYERPERCTVLPAELGAVIAHIRGQRLKGAA